MTAVVTNRQIVDVGYPNPNYVCVVANGPVATIYPGVYQNVIPPLSPSTVIQLAVTVITGPS